MKVRPVGADEASEVKQPRRPKYTTKLAHPTYSIEPCPNCSYPEADGSYCPECDWFAYDPRCPHCRKLSLK